MFNNTTPFSLMQTIQQIHQMQQIQQMYNIQQILQSQVLPQTQQSNAHSDDSDGEVDDEGERTLFCANFDERVDEEILYELFLQAGPLECVRLPKQRTFAFITYSHKCSPVYAMHLFQGITLYGKPLVIKFQSKTSVPPLTRRLLPPDWGIIKKETRSVSQKHSFDNSALRGPNFNSHANDMGIGDSWRNSNRSRSPTRNSNQHTLSDNTGRRNEKDNWVHGPDQSRRERMGRVRSHNASGPYERRRESSRKGDRDRDRERDRDRDRSYDDGRNNHHHYNEKRSHKFI